MIWGSYYPDAPHIFLEDADLSGDMWGKRRAALPVCADPKIATRTCESLLEGKQGPCCLMNVSDRTLYTDRPL